MKHILPKTAALLAAPALLVSLAACSPDGGVPGVAPLGSDTRPGVTLTDPPQPAPQPSQSEQPSQTLPPSEPSQDPETSAPPQTLPPSEPGETINPSPTTSSTSKGGFTDKWKADQAVCKEAYDAHTDYKRPSDTTKYYEIYFTRADNLDGIAQKATIAEIKDAIVALATTNREFGEASRDGDRAKAEGLRKAMQDKSSAYYKGMSLVYQCQVGIEFND